MEHELYHHGVKGMKWGVRRYQNKDGSLTAAGKKRSRDVTQVSKRKLKKQVRESLKHPESGKYTAALDKKITQKMSKTKEGRDWNNAYRNLKALNQEAHNRGGRLVLTRAQVDELNSYQQAYINRAKQMVNSHMEDYAGAKLKDLGYEDTKAGRDYLIKNRIIHKAK